MFYRKLAICTLGVAFLLARGPCKASGQQKQQPDDRPSSPVTINCNSTSGQQDAPNKKAQEADSGIKWGDLSNWALVFVGIVTFAYIAKQTKATSKSAAAAEKSAVATEQTMNALQNSERAWVLVELKCSPSTMISNGTGAEGETTAIMDVELHCTNHGSSPAWITEKSARLVNARELPPFPLLTEEDVISAIPEPVGPGKDSVQKWNPSGEGNYSPLQSALVVYGRVKYKDIFQAERETWFCYQLYGDSVHRKFIRVNVPSAYIKHT